MRIRPTARRTPGTGTRTPTRTISPSPALATLLAPLAALLAAVPAPLVAQDAKIERRAQFVRSLAKPPLAFISLAQDQVDEMMKNTRQADSFKIASQLKIEVALIGAKLLRDREQQRTHYKQALDSLEEFVSRYEGDPVALNARMTLTDACTEYGRFLIDELEMARLDNPARVPPLEEEAANVFRRGVDACNAAMKGLAEMAKKDDTKAIEHDIVWLRKGILLREHGRAVKKERGPLCEQARNTLEELILKVGEETALGQKAFFEYAQIDEVLGNLEGAVRSYRDVIGAIYTAMTSDEIEFSPEVKELLVVMMEEAYHRLTDVLLQLGRGSEVLTTVADYREQMKKLGAKEDDTHGHATLLNAARAKWESGEAAKVTEALAEAQKINDAHPGADVVGLKAKKLIKDILAAQSSLVSGKLLFEVAVGDYQDKRYEAAIKGFKKALGQMSDQERQQYGLQAWTTMGRCFALQKRFLESVLSLKQGLETFGRKGGEDTEQASRLLEAAVGGLRQTTSRDKAFDRLEQEATALVASYGGERSEAEHYWNQGRRQATERKYVDAAASYEKVPQGTAYFELAQARRVDALKRAGEIDQAKQQIATFRKYMEGNPKLEKPELEQFRRQALAEMDFQEADLLFDQAMGVVGGKEDPTKLPDVINLLNDWRQKHGEVADYLTMRVLDQLGRAYAKIGQLAKAEQQYQAMYARDAKSGDIPRLGSVIFSAYLDRVRAGEVELGGEASAKKGSELDAVKKKLRDARMQALAFGLDYAKKAPKPQYEILWNALAQADALQEWKSAQQLAEQILTEYGSDAEYTAKIDQWVKPVLGRILLEKGNYQQAYDMLLAAEKAQPKNLPVKRLICLALGGWMSFDEKGSVVEHPGLERYGEAYEKYFVEYRPYVVGRTPDYSLDWYQFHWEAYYFANKASTKDSKYASYARTLFSKAQAFENFQALKDLGDEGKRLFDMFTRLPPPR